MPLVKNLTSQRAIRGGEGGSDLGAGLEDGHVPLRQMFRDFEPAAAGWIRTGQRSAEGRQALYNPDLPAFVGDNLLLDQLSV